MRAKLMKVGLYVDFFFFETITTQTNLCATQRNAKKLKPVTTRDIDIFLYVNFMFGIHKLPRDYLDVICAIHTCVISTALLEFIHSLIKIK